MHCLYRFIQLPAGRAFPEGDENCLFHEKEVEKMIVLGAEKWDAAGQEFLLALLRFCVSGCQPGDDQKRRVGVKIKSDKRS